MLATPAFLFAVLRIAILLNLQECELLQQQLPQFRCATCCCCESSVARFGRENRTERNPKSTVRCAGDLRKSLCPFQYSVSHRAVFRALREESFRAISFFPKVAHARNTSFLVRRPVNCNTAEFAKSANCYTSSRSFCNFVVVVRAVLELRFTTERLSCAILSEMAATATMMSVSLCSPSRSLLPPAAADFAASTASGALLRCSPKFHGPAVAFSSRAAMAGDGPKLAKAAGVTPNVAMRRTSITVNTAAVASPVDLNARRPEVETAIDEGMTNCITETYLNDSIPSLGPKIRGKVRDIYEAGDYMVLVTTDRQSAFDRVLASVPFKGQVLNQTSVWWFSNTKHITDNAIVSAPDPNVTIAKKCTVFPVEFVVRGFMTGSTSTSLWTVYNNGVRNYCGNDLAEGMKKNEKLKANIITPTTKAADHDLPISGAEIVEQGLMSKEDYEEVKSKALSLFKFGQEVALKHGLLLVDTKYEFGKTSDGTIVLIDEVHTPDSSRYWIAASYEERHRQGLEPENIDKEFLRLWFKNKCDPYNDEVLPEAPKELVAELSWRYIMLYETITGNDFMLPDTKEPLQDRIVRNVQDSLQHLL